MSNIPIENTGTPADVVEARLVRRRHPARAGVALVVRGTYSEDHGGNSHSVVIGDWKSAENLAYEILEAVRAWPTE